MLCMAKRQFNSTLPDEVETAFAKEVVARVGIKNKWEAVTAAVVAFLSLSEAEQNAAIQRVRQADGPGGSFKDLVNLAGATHAAASTPPGKKKWYPKYDKLVSDERTATKHRQ
jgi:hypothetical protein